MKSFLYLLTIAMMLTATACSKGVPEPESKIRVQAVNYPELAHDIPVSSYENNNRDPLYVKYKVNGKDVLVECIVHGITFRDTSANNKGKILLFVDGKKKEEITSAAFIVKGLSSGTHRIKLEIIKSNQPTSLKKEFYVTIP